MIESTNNNWAQSTSSIIEEQVERSFQQSKFAMINSSPFKKLYIVMSTVLIVLISTMFALISQDSAHYELQKSFWLTANNIVDLKKDSSPITFDRVFKMQLSNIEESTSKPGYQLLKNWHFYAAIAPFIISIGVFFYMLFYCYPSAVFNWGDISEWYTSILQRRRSLWTAIIIGLFIGLIANISIYGIISISS